MASFLLWYLSVSLVGLAAFPLAFRLLPALPDRGFAFSRALGLLLWGYFFWLLVSLGFAQNDLGGQFLAFLILVGLGLWALRGLSQAEIGEWWRANRGQVIGVEVLFFAAFAAWALVRSANPEIVATEKPMELAFINSILRSPSFPPHDPWLSGYAISYYYFGYVLVAMLAMLTNVPGSVAFNLGVSLVFALSAIGAYGMLYNLLRVFWDERRSRAGDPVPGSSPGNRAASGALFAPLFVLLYGNLEGFLEVLHARGLFWAQDAAGQLSSRFWTWLDIQDLTGPPVEPFSWTPTRYLWWWRASRVLQDYDLAGNWREVIDEFPFFSYLLADLHPHVLAMPFAFLAMAVAFNLFLGGSQGSLRWFGMWLRTSPQAFVLAAIVLGGLAFLNTWDFPIYLALVCGAYVLRSLNLGNAAAEVERLEDYPAGEVGLLPALQGLGNGIDSPPYPRPAFELVKDFFRLGLALGVTGILFYLPFYVGFSSQAGGVIPNLIYVTRGAHLWVMFGVFFLPLAAFLFYLWRGSGNGNSFRKGLLLATGLVLFLWLTALLLGLLAANLPQIGDLYLNTLGALGNQQALPREAFTRRIANTGSLLTLLALVAGVLALLWPAYRMRLVAQPKPELVETEMAGQTPFSPNPSPLFLSHRFALLLILVGALLVLGPEFYFLRDQFGYRINTIFKFYYQAWLFWGIAAAYGAAVLLRQLRGLSKALFTVGLVLLSSMALVYPVLSLWEKTTGFNPPGGLTLDGAGFMQRRSPDEWAAIEWLRSATPGVVVEAVGGSYSEYARVATFSGQPNLLGWPGHESQWRGGGQEMGSRQSDIETIYRSNNWDEVHELLDRYNVRYVFVGLLEQSTYRVNEANFRRFLTPVFQQGQVTVYWVP
jgi:YYY domain-containing protein